MDSKDSIIKAVLGTCFADRKGVYISNLDSSPNLGTFISHNWDHVLGSSDVQFLNRTGHQDLQTYQAEIRSDIDLLKSISADEDFQNTLSQPIYRLHGNFIGAVANALCPPVAIYQCGSQVGGYGSGATIDVSVVSEPPDASLTVLVSLKKLTAIETIVAEADINRDLLKTELSRLRSISRLVTAKLIAVMRRFRTTAVISTALLRECPWHLVHGTHPPAETSAFTFLKARGFATA